MFDIGDTYSLGLLLSDLGFFVVVSLGLVVILKRFKIPAVLGLILGGVILQSLNLLSNQILHFDLDSDLLGFSIFEFQPIIVTLSLAWIGYDIGNEIDLHLLRDKGKSLGIILLAESLGAFFLVMIGTVVILNIFMPSPNNFGYGMILGSIAMATDPASTSQIIGEYRAKGQLSQTVLFIIAFDDILAILFVNMSINYTINADPINFLIILNIIIALIIEIIVAVGVGLIGGLFIYWLSKQKEFDQRELIEWLIGIAVLIIGFNIVLEGSVILSMFVYGMVLKTQEVKNKALHDHILLLEYMMIPLLLLFFIFIGLSLDLNIIFSSALGLIILYLVFRGIGKGLGAYIAGSKIGLPKKVRNNLPFTLIPQAGVTVGLIALAYEALLSVGKTEEGLLILNVITGAVLISQIFGPLLVKKALFNAGEPEELIKL